MKRRELLGIAAGLAVLPVCGALGQESNGPERRWCTDTEPLEQAFPALGPLADARWVSSRDDERDLPSPELAISGFARLAPGTLAELAAAHTFVSGAPADDFPSWFEEPLRGEGPDDPHWVRSDTLDRDADGSSTRLWFDRRTRTVRFRALNPYG
ncbi:hypothetical protein [Streptomyces sp. NPDC060194]|uniref:hypothetical protein n=1 Tax=Streptomyces sp. NPDC060194 TaxID=3347069 RepID=UPI003652D94F